MASSWRPSGPAISLVRATFTPPRSSLSLTWSAIFRNLPVRLPADQVAAGIGVAAGMLTDRVDYPTDHGVLVAIGFGRPAMDDRLHIRVENVRDRGDEFAPIEAGADPK